MKIIAIAQNTFRESSRDRIMLGVVLFTVAIILSSIATVNFTIGQWTRLTVDVGLSAISFFGVILSIFMGINLLSKEIDRKTVYTIVSKPVPRHQFVLGKYIGLSCTIALNTALMLAILYLVLVYLSPMEGAPYLPIFKAWLLMLLEFMVVTAIATFFSSFTTPPLAAMFTIVLWIAGHLVSDLRIWGIKEDNPLIHTAIKIGTFILPNLEIFNVRNRVMYGIDIGWGYTGWVAAYAGLSIIFFLGIASVIFTKRDFK